MGMDSKIEWTEATWNPIRGCTRVSEGCRNCYAEAIAGRFSKPGQAYHRLAKMTSLGARWTGRADLIEKRLFDPLRWKEPRRIFVNSTSDICRRLSGGEFKERRYRWPNIASRCNTLPK